MVVWLAGWCGVVVVLGDLNYRMKSSPEEVLSLVSGSAKATISHYTTPGDHTSAADGSGSRGQPAGGSAVSSSSGGGSCWREASLAPIFHRHDSRPDDPGPGEKGEGGGGLSWHDVVGWVDWLVDYGFSSRTPALGHDVT